MCGYSVWSRIINPVRWLAYRWYKDQISVSATLTANNRQWCFWYLHHMLDETVQPELFVINSVKYLRPAIEGLLLWTNLQHDFISIKSWNYHCDVIMPAGVFVDEWKALNIDSNLYLMTCIVKSVPATRWCVVSFPNFTFAHPGLPSSVLPYFFQARCLYFTPCHFLSVLLCGLMGNIRYNEAISVLYWICCREVWIYAPPEARLFAQSLQLQAVGLMRCCRSRLHPLLVVNDGHRHYGIMLQCKEQQVAHAKQRLSGGRLKCFDLCTSSWWPVSCLWSSGFTCSTWLRWSRTMWWTFGSGQSWKCGTCLVTDVTISAFVCRVCAYIHFVLRRPSCARLVVI